VTLAGFLLGTVSGSGVATTVMLGSVAWPILRRAGYAPERGGAMLSAAGIGGFGVAVRQAQATHEEYVPLGDAGILQFAYQLELLEGNFYAIGADSGLFRSTFLDHIAIIPEHEFPHAEAIATQWLAIPIPPKRTNVTMRPLWVVSA
jgi:hypothetical protein